MNLKLPTPINFTLNKADIFAGQTKTVWQPVSKVGKMKAINAEEEFYLNPNTAHIFDIKFNLNPKTKTNVDVNIEKYEALLKRNKQIIRDQFKKDADDQNISKETL